MVSSRGSASTSPRTSAARRRTSFNAGETLATAYPGPDWMEWGWAKALDTPAVTWAECGCTEEDNVSPGGRAFARFLRSLGAMTDQDPGPGPMYAGGSC